MDALTCRQMGSYGASRVSVRLRAFGACLALSWLTAFSGCAALGKKSTGNADEDFVRSRYAKREVQVPMRDGVKLFTAIYSPKDTRRPYPIMLFRTPYSINPYGEDKYRESLGPSDLFARDGFIFVYQDVRGRFMSEGEFENMRPHIDHKKSPSEIDESSDTYDTIEWLLSNVPNHNGRVGMWGISYPGFYAAAGMIDAHSALKAVSPQAPIADWYFDDFYHHGAFFLPHAFNFFVGFGKPRPKPTTEWGERFKHGTPDGYQFFLDLGPLKNVNERYYHNEIAFWNDIVAHPAYDEFWQSRNIVPHLSNVAPAVMVVGGWFDAEDLYGPLQIYRSVERRNPGITNSLVMGPWRHGGWSRSDGDRLGNARFGSKTSVYYREHIEFPFFACALKDRCDTKLSEAHVFETGANRWHALDVWPPANLVDTRIWFHPAGRLSLDAAPDEDTDAGYDEYVSDPSKPVPFTEAVAKGMTDAYMADDQRFAARRPDVLAYQTEVLEEDVTIAGPILADLWVSTSGTDSDWVVKLIDVFPPDAEDPDGICEHWHAGGAQMMVRSEAIRGRYRQSYEQPVPFTPNEHTSVRLPMQDVFHTFQKGHRIMVQIQSTWFPLVDRNPQKFVENIFLAEESDFIKATQRVYHSAKHPSSLQVGVMRRTQSLPVGISGSLSGR